MKAITMLARLDATFATWGMVAASLLQKPS